MLRFGKITAPYRAERAHTLRQVSAVLPPDDPLRRRWHSPIEAVDWYHYEIGTGTRLETRGVYAVLQDELVRCAGFEWVVDLERHSQAPLLRPTRNGFLVENWSAVSNWLHELLPSDDVSFAEIFWTQLEALYAYSPNCDAGWHPLLDIEHCGTTTLWSAERVTAARLNYCQAPSEVIAAAVRQLGFAAWPKTALS
jgi:hypothetical protein